MADKPPSPFSGLDKALLRSTKPSTPPSVPPAEQQNQRTEQSIVSEKAHVQPTTRPVDEEANRPNNEPTTRPGDASSGRREFIRRGFKWYADQLRALKKLSLQEQMEDKPGNMSQMVREALDEYLKKRGAI